MLKLKMLVGFAFVLGAFMTTAAPALAEFQATPSKESITHGSTTIIAAGAFFSGFSKGTSKAGEVACPAAGITAEWKIRSTGKVTEELTGPNQQPTKRGPHQQYNIKWEKTINGCTALGAVAADVAPCAIQVHQPRGALTSAAADVVEACVIKIPAVNCTITIPAANEATGANFQLTKVELENKLATNSNKVTANVTGITQTVTGTGCPLVSNANGQLTGLIIENIAEVLV